MRDSNLAPLLVLTGQQAIDCGEYGLSGFEQLALNCAGERNPHRHVQRVASSVYEYLGTASPRLLVVQGDTSSAYGAARAAFQAGVSVAHVEAGLRTHDARQPWPEEEYRVAIDAEATLLFAPTEGAAANLRAEKVSGAIHVTGNTAVDALLAIMDQLPPKPRARAISRILVTCHRRESWGRGLASIAAALTGIAAQGLAHIQLVLHPNPHVASTMRRRLDGVRNLELLEPCPYPELVQRMRDADLILSDSGGIQEEAPTIGTPLLVLRDKTERPEGIASGNACLVGTRSGRIVAEVERLLTDREALAAMSKPSFPYGDGKSGPRIAEIIRDWLEKW